MKKSALLLAAVFAVCFAAPAFAQNYGANNHLEDFPGQVSQVCKCVGEMCKRAGEWLVETVESSGIGKCGYATGIPPTTIQQQTKKAEKGAKKDSVTGAKAGKAEKAPSKNNIKNAVKRNAAKQKAAKNTSKETKKQDVYMPLGSPAPGGSSDMAAAKILGY